MKVRQKIYDKFTIVFMFSVAPISCRVIDYIITVETVTASKSASIYEL